MGCTWTGKDATDGPKESGDLLVLEVFIQTVIFPGPKTYWRSTELTAVIAPLENPEHKQVACGSTGSEAGSVIGRMLVQNPGPAKWFHHFTLEQVPKPSFAPGTV